MLINLVNKKILLIGGGEVAYQKAKSLIKQKENFKVISKEFIFELKELLRENKIEFVKKEIQKEDLKGFDVIIDATGNEKVKKFLLENKDFLLNVVDEPKFCDFYFGSVARKGEISVLVSSSAKAPRLTQVIRDRIERILEDSQLNRKCSYEEFKKDTSKVFLIGCGPGAVDLLTIRAYNSIRTLEVALYDHLINPEILKLLPKSCEKIYVGKQKGKHSFKQEEINKLILKYAKEGKIVGRLKSGHPFVFARGAEEFEFLTQNGINVEVIEGISSAFCAPSVANIPLTKRDEKKSFMVVSAHLKGNKINLDWVEYLKDESIRVVVLMGLSRVFHIQKRAFELNIDENKKVAIISNASLPNQEVIYTTLKDLVIEAKKAKKPAVLVF